MKKTILTIVAAFISIISFAAKNPTVSIVPLGNEKAVITVLNERPALYEVTFRADNGDMVYYKRTEKPSPDFQQVYDVKHLAEGHYTVSLKVDNMKVINDLDVSKNGLTIGTQKLQIDPYFSFINNELKLSYLNFEGENLKLLIYGNDGLIYESELGRDFNITSGYDLSKLDKDSYRVILSSYNNQYTFDIVK